MERQVVTAPSWDQKDASGSPSPWTQLAVSTFICHSHSDKDRTQTSWGRKWEHEWASQYYFRYVLSQSKSILHIKDKTKYILMYLPTCNCMRGDSNSLSSHMCSIKKNVAITALQVEIDWLTICRFAFKVTYSWNLTEKFWILARKKAWARWQGDSGTTKVFQGTGSSRTSGLGVILGSKAKVLFCPKHLGNELLEPGSAGTVFRV